MIKTKLIADRFKGYDLGPPIKVKEFLYGWYPPVVNVYTSCQQKYSPYELECLYRHSKSRFISNEVALSTPQPPQYLQQNRISNSKSASAALHRSKSASRARAESKQAADIRSRSAVKPNIPVATQVSNFDEVASYFNQDLIDKEFKLNESERGNSRASRPKTAASGRQSRIKEDKSLRCKSAVTRSVVSPAYTVDSIQKEFQDIIRSKTAVPDSSHQVQLESSVKSRAKSAPVIRTSAMKPDSRLSHRPVSQATVGSRAPSQLQVKASYTPKPLPVGNSYPHKTWSDDDGCYEPRVVMSPPVSLQEMNENDAKVREYLSKLSHTDSNNLNTPLNPSRSQSRNQRSQSNMSCRSEQRAVNSNQQSLRKTPVPNSKALKDAQPKLDTLREESATKSRPSPTKDVKDINNNKQQTPAINPITNAIRNSNKPTPRNNPTDEMLQKAAFLKLNALQHHSFGSKSTPSFVDQFPANASPRSTKSSVKSTQISVFPSTKELPSDSKRSKAASVLSCSSKISINHDVGVKGGYREATNKYTAYKPHFSTQQQLIKWKTAE